MMIKAGTFAAQREHLSKSGKVYSFLFVISSLILTACGGGDINVPPPQHVTPTSIAITPLSGMVGKGDNSFITATGTYPDGSTANLTSQVTWSSSDPSVATINSTTGVATGVAVGSATITASIYGVTSPAASLTVTSAAVTGVNIAQATSSAPKGQAVTLVATGTYSDGTTGDISGSVNWMSRNATVASVNASGIASTLAVGKTNVTAQINGITSNTSTLTVTAAKLASIAITPANASVSTGLNTHLTAIGTYTDATTADISNLVIWTSDNGAIATINNIGDVTGVAAGSTTLGASLNGINSPSVSLTVKEASLTGIEIAAQSIPAVAKGQSITFIATGYYSDGTVGNVSGGVTWTSSIPTVATMNASGIATTLAQGSTNMHASFNGIASNTVTLRVTAPELTAMAINLNTATVAIGLTTRFTATGIYTDGSTADITSLASWTSGDTAIATINRGSGVATGVAKGSVRISATLNGITSAGTKLNVSEINNISLTKLVIPSWGPITIEDFNHDNIYEVLGTYGTETGPISIPRNQGIGPALFNSPGLVLRDLRYADLNNDGILDVVFNVYSENNPDSYIQLYWGNPDGTFSIDSYFSTNRFSGYGETIVVADFDNDGYLEIFIPQYQTETGPYSRNLLFRNRTNGVFEEVALAANIGFSRIHQPEGAQAVDFDFDGFVDIYVGGSLFKNLGGLRFSDVTPLSGLPGVFEEGAKFFDFNDDGYLDFLLHTLPGGPRLFLSDATYKFTEVTDVFPANDGFYASYGMNVGDVNSDGYEDILLAGGKDINGQMRPPRLWLYKDGQFVDTYFVANSFNWSDLVSFGDLDNNGSLDITLRYGDNITLLNNYIPNYHIKISVLDNGLRNQQGRVVKANFNNGKTKSFVVDGGSGFLSIQPYPILVANNSGEPILFTVYCSNKTLEFSAVEGNFSVDCSKSSVLKH